MLRWTIIACIFAATCSSASADDYATALQGWAAVLGKFVDEEGRVAFADLAQDRAEFDAFVAYVARIGPASAPAHFDTPDKVLAYHINAYNALAMHGVIEEGIPDGFNGFFKRAGFFKFRKIIVDGRKTSLYDYENKVIRPLAEPRVHFALNCMVRDCPRLPQQPFTAADLESQLQAATLEFFGKNRHLEIEHDKRAIRVSEILKFYTEDFVASNRRQDLVGYINQYRDEPIPRDYKVRFIPYDWTINSQK